MDDQVRIPACGSHCAGHRLAVTWVLATVCAYVAAVQPADAQSVRQARREAATQKADAAAAKKPQVDKSRLRYGGKSFDQWKELFLNDVEPATRIKALPALVKLGRYGYVQEAALKVPRYGN